jgi:Histidine kinase-like ATPase domain
MTLAPASPGTAGIVVTGPANPPAGPPDVSRGRHGVAERAFPARPDQVRAARRFTAALLAGCPVADDAVLCVSELATNCVIHSATARWGGTFRVRVQVRAGDCVWLEVADEGGPWREPVPDDRLHGLEIVWELTSESGIAGGPFTGWVVWARLGWPR